MSLNEFIVDYKNLAPKIKYLIVQYLYNMKLDAYYLKANIKRTVKNYMEQKNNYTYIGHSRVFNRFVNESNTQKRDPMESLRFFKR